MNPRDLLNKFAAKELEFRSKEFVAPYVHIPGRPSYAIVKMDNVNYRFRIVGFSGAGIGIFKPTDPTCAKFSNNAEYDLVREFYDKLPASHFILSFQTEEGWCAYPMNMQVANQKLGLDSEVLIRNISDVERFDTVIARYDGYNFWFDEPFAGADLLKAQSMREAFDLRVNTAKSVAAIEKIKGLTPEERKSFNLALESWKVFTKQTTEEKIKHLLEIGGGSLRSYVVRGANIEVRWKSVSGADYTSVVKKDSFDIVSSGICLSGEDKKFHLKDLPGIIAHGEEQGLIYVINPPHRAIDMRTEDDD